ncbi:hypothetical protein [Streptomyces sp. NPDC048663]|uniref:hypothetical protein n=1 Tax=Streptomyces sp. NPDC048663 TaxID=3155638 RepID=UPI003421ED90
MTEPSPDTTPVVRAAEAMTTQLQRIADALSTPVVRTEVVAADGAPTPATTCSAQHHRFDDGRECIRAAHHTGKDHVDERGFHWSDTVAVYPVDSTVRTAPAADEEQTLRWARRESLLVLLSRLQRGRPVTESEADTLRTHVETEIREADTARAEVTKWLAFIERGMETHMQFGVLQPDGATEQLPCADWCHACRLEQAQAAIERVRAVCVDPNHTNMILTRNVLAALDGTEPTTEA